MSEAIRNQVVQIAQNELNSRKNVGENVHGETWYNVFDWKAVTESEGDDNKGDYAQNKAKSGKRAWCKAFIVNCVAKKVSGGTMLVSILTARPTGSVVGSQIKPDNYTTYTNKHVEYAHQIDFPVPGVVWYRPPNGKDGGTTGHVGVVVDVNYNDGYFITIEGNASERLMSKKYTFGNIKWENEHQPGISAWQKANKGAPTINGNSTIQSGPFTSFYLMFDENIGSLKNSASKYGGVELFYKKYKDAKSVQGWGVPCVPNKPSKKPGKGGGTVVDPSNTNTSSTSDPGTSSSEKQPFEIPYMTVAEATDYLKNLSNPNQGNGNGTTTGNIPLTAGKVE